MLKCLEIFITKIDIYYKDVYISVLESFTETICQVTVYIWQSFNVLTIDISLD